MLTFLIVEEKKNELPLLFSLVVQISITNPNSNIICACKENTFAILNRYCPENVKLVNYKITESKSSRNIKYILLNYLNALEYALKNYDNVLFLGKDVFLAHKIPITQELIDQGIAFIRSETFDSNKNIILHTDTDTTYEYFTTPLFISSEKIFGIIKQYFSDNCNVFEDESEEELKIENEIKTTDNKERLMEILKSEKEIRDEYYSLWNDLPKVLVDEISIEKYIPKTGYIKTNDFFKIKDSFKKEDVYKEDNVIKHKGNTVWGISINTSVYQPRIIELNSYLTCGLIKLHETYLPLINMMYLKSLLKIKTPNKQGFLHWNRENDSFYGYLDSLVIDNPVFELGNFENGTHFYVNNYVLYDKPDIKYLTPNVGRSFGILFFDYSNELLEVFESIDIKTIFMGYYSAYPKILEDFIDPKDVSRIGTKTLKEEDYSNEEEFKLYLDDLSTFKYFNIDKDTPKNRIAECLRLGVVPRVLDETKLLDIEDIANDKETDWEILSEKCREYYSSNLSNQAITDKLVKINFSM